MSAQTPPRTPYSEALKRYSDNAAGSDDTTPLKRAVSQRYPGSSDVVAELLDHKADVDETAGDGLSPLVVATMLGNGSVADLLLRSKADPDLQTRDGDSPITVAAARDDQLLAKRLFAAGVNLYAKNRRRMTAKDIATGNKVVNFLSFLAVVEAFFDAIRADDAEKVEEYVAAGLGPLGRNNRAESAIHWAVRHNASKVISVLCKQEGVVDHQDFFGRTPLHLAVQKHFVESVRALLESGASVFLWLKDMPVLSMAADMPLPPESDAKKRGAGYRKSATKYRESVSPHHRIFNLLVRYGANIREALQYTRNKVKPGSHDSVIEQALVLLQRQAEVLALDLSTLAAANMSHVKWPTQKVRVKLLVNQGVSVVSRGSKNPFPPLISAVFQKNYRLMRLLLKLEETILAPGLDEEYLELYNLSKAKALAFAVEWGMPRYVKLLLKHGASLEKINYMCFQPLFDCWPEAYYVEQDWFEQFTILGHLGEAAGVTRLHLAVKNKQLPVVNVLLDPLKQLDVNAATHRGIQPLHLACEAGWPEGAAKLIGAGADVNAVTNDGLTPLHLLVLLPRGEAKQQLRSLLMLNGAREQVTAECGSPADYAAQFSGSTPLQLRRAIGSPLRTPGASRADRLEKLAGSTRKKLDL